MSGIYDKEDSGSLKTRHRTPTDDELHRILSEEDEREIEANALSAQELEEAEANAQAEEDEDDANDQPPEEEPKKDLKQQATKKGMSGTTKALLGGSIGGILVLLLIFMFFFSILGQLKTVHFATVLRSAGFAQFQRVMGKAYAQTIFDDSVLTDNSTGRLSLKPTGWMARRLKVLGREGLLRWDASNGFTGIEINKTMYNINDYSQRAFGKNFSDLSTRQRWTVQAQFGEDIRIPLGDALATKNLAYRSTAYIALFKVAGVSLIKWLNAAKDFVGKTPKQAMAENVDETIKEVNDGDLKSSSGMMEKDAQNQLDETKAAAEAGLPTDSIKPSPRMLQINKISSNISDAALLITTMCIVNDLNNSFQQMAQKQELNTVRLAANTLTTHDQETAGDTVHEATDAENTTWQDAESSVTYKQDTGQALTAADMASAGSIPPVFAESTFAKVTGIVNQAFDTLIFGPNLLGLASAVVGKQTVKDNLCNVAMNEYVQYGIAGGEIVVAVATAGSTKGVTAALKAAVEGTLKLAASVSIGDLLGKLLDSALKNMSNTNYSGVVNGPQKYDQTHMAIDYVSANSNRMMNFGAPVSKEDSAVNKRIALNDIKQEYNSQGAYERYLAIDNPFSLLGSMVAIAPTSFSDFTNSLSGLIRSTASALGSPFAMFSSLLNIFSGTKAFAQTATANTVTGQDYGIQEWDYTPEELGQIEGDSSFKTAPNGTGPLDQFMKPRLADLDSKYMKCYTPPLQSQIPDDGDCTQEKLGWKKGKDITILKWRWYHTLQTVRAEGNKPMSAFVVQ